MAGLGENPVKVRLLCASPVYAHRARSHPLCPCSPQNARALLRNSLPIKNKQIRVAQAALESISDDLRVPGVRFSGVESSVRRALDVVVRDSAALLKDIPAKNAEAGAAAIAGLKQTLQDFQVVVANKDKQEVPLKQQEALNYVSAIEEAMVDGFPFAVPAPYDTLPLLKGRAEVLFTFKLKNGRAGAPEVKRDTMLVVLDGYNAPVTAGNFLDLVQRGFYTGMEVQRNDGFVVQSGDPGKGKVGFQGPDGKLRTIPLEIMVKGDKVPLYGETLEDVRRFKEDPALPFNAFGTLAMARGEFENDSASSQWFFLLKESELTPSGTNILDGRYGVFGYAVEGQELLRDAKVGDIIESITITRGAENFVGGSRAAPVVAETAAATTTEAE